ncbi:Mammalian cell entry related domain protein [Geobacter metallireducens RCH3]|uniref:ABC transporter, periplasmic substrate-binding protein, MCE domain-containing n=1 Tax=Geobacter metallireducens (strain ATCC 53774 / DSM 7210 / GS-15) TaxID=269799 RepID=Q39SL4_GEOMG|nr:MlaD family protein [Geobacter metallireducens]ABB32760.1 ABC transporter, periplasmic substrate-binding protein, MCE domain-containing [Geobacter metallireducens GS-15]EHP86130.1 Mammalian cell entry related domain protein [Geobacter metallireducens RCH3]
MKRSDNVSWSQLKGGIFILVALAFFAGGVLLMGDKTKFFVPKGRLSVIMADVAGLKAGAPVWLAGVDVGVVTQIHFERPEATNEVEIVLEVDREALKKIGADSVVTVKTRGLMGEKYVDITPTREIVAKPVTRLQGTPMPKLDDVVQKAGRAFDRVDAIVAKTERGEGTLGRFASDPKLYDSLVRLTTELNAVAVSVNRGEGTLGMLNKSREPYEKLMSILNRADNTLTDIQSSEGTMSKLIHDRELYDKLVAVASKAGTAADEVRELNRRLLSKDGTLGKLVADREFYDRGLTLINRADTSLKSLEEVTARLQRGEGTAGKLLSDRELYDRLNRTVDDLDLLVKDIKENPKRYVKFSVF